MFNTHILFTRVFAQTLKCLSISALVVEARWSMEQGTKFSLQFDLSLVVLHTDYCKIFRLIHESEEAINCIDFKGVMSGYRRREYYQHLAAAMPSKIIVSIVVYDRFIEKLTNAWRCLEDCLCNSVTNAFLLWKLQVMGHHEQKLERLDKTTALTWFFY